MEKIISESKIDQVSRYIDRFDRIVTVCHVSPDGDAIGASLGLYHFLTALGKQVTPVVPDALPENLRFLAGAKDILNFDRYPEYGAELIDRAELIFCLDFNQLSRTGDGIAALVARASAKKVMIDHHLHPGDFCDVAISHPEIASTSELVFRLIFRMGMFDILDVRSATAIYTGMMTDTGNFTYNSNRPDIYFIIEELVRKGIDKDEIYTKVFNTFSADKVRLNGYATCHKLEVFPEHRAAMITLSREELNRFHYRKGDTEGLVNVPLGIEGIVFSAFFREEKNYIKISLRSKGRFPANKVAAEHFNGGGHLNAAGGEFYGTMDEIKAAFKALLPQYAEYL
ncbi:MAG: bifunctional oligoribonuclease/PAP phosphatase NrnA [Coprobacter sp.]|nr:bifunctional oligoribonuclease/PAP phosphatase NrnA [Coprobacter sp.]